MRIASEKNADRLRQVEDYRRQRDEAKAAAAALETKVALMLKRAEIAEENSSRFERELTAAEESSRAVSVKYEALFKLRDRDLRVSSHEARRGVKGAGVSMVNQRGDYRDLEAEAASMAEDLPVAEAKLAAMPLPALDLDELAKSFDDSTPPEDAVDCESALVFVDAHVAGDAAPLEITPLAMAPFRFYISLSLRT
ncbi:unnamed protein product [Cochlearia groenlandica]